jgi:hypothetical protein
MANAAYPYRQATSDAVRADVWFIEAAGKRQPLDSYVPEWDYNTDLQLSCEVAVDAEAVRSQTQLPADAPLALTVSWFSKTTFLRDIAYRRELQDPSFAGTIEVRLPGQRLAGTLVLETRVLSMAATEKAEDFVAHLPGSVLWQKRDETRLQGDAPLFPISVVDFARAGFPPLAPWKLVVDGGVENALLGSVRLYVNADNPIVVEAFQSAAPRPEDDRVLSAAYADVARLLLEYALAEYQSIPPDPDPDSLGFALQRIVENIFPGESAQSIRERWEAHPTDFGAELLARVKLFQ